MYRRRPVKCYECSSHDVGSVCADPYNDSEADLHPAIEQKMCDGPCAKWVQRPKNGERTDTDHVPAKVYMYLCICCIVGHCRFRRSRRDSDLLAKLASQHAVVARVYAGVATGRRRAVLLPRRPLQPSEQLSLCVARSCGVGNHRESARSPPSFCSTLRIAGAACMARVTASLQQR